MIQNSGKEEHETGTRQNSEPLQEIDKRPRFGISEPPFDSTNPQIAFCHDGNENQLDE